MQQAVIREEQQNKTIATFQHDASLPYEDIDVKSIVLDDMQKSPYTARIEFERVFTSSGDQAAQKRERWIASVTYVYADKVKNEALSVNPPGLTIVRFRADQAFN